jgi:hypothetical protein
VHTDAYSAASEDSWGDRGRIREEAWTHSGADTAVACRNTAAARTACSWRTCVGSSAGDTAARTGEDGEEAASSGSLVPYQVQVHDRAQDLLVAVLRSCRRAGSLQASARVLLVPKVCSAQPADGG